MYGSHVKFNEDLSSTARNALDNGMTAMQIFLGSPYSHKRREIEQGDMNCFNYGYADRIQVFSHLPYILNLAGKAKNNTYAYDNDDQTDQSVSECIKSIQSELNTVSKLKCGCKGCVLHMGSIGTLKDRRKGCEAVAKSINRLTLSSPLLLETMVGRGGVLGTSFEELAKVYSLVEDKSNVGVCIDTCHVFAEGKYDLKKATEVDQMFEDFDRVLGRNTLRLVHLNDSQVAFGMRQDRHEEIGKGWIWKDDKSGLKQLLQQCTSRGVPVVMETDETTLSGIAPYLPSRTQ